MAGRDYGKAPKSASSKRRALFERMPWPAPDPEADYEPYHRPSSLAMFEDVDVGRGQQRHVSRLREGNS